MFELLPFEFELVSYKKTPADYWLCLIKKLLKNLIYLELNFFGLQMKYSSLKDVFSIQKDINS